MTLLIAMNMILIVIVIWLIVYILNDSSPLSEKQPTTIQSSTGQTMNETDSQHRKSPEELVVDINTAVGLGQEVISVNDRTAQAIDKFKNTMASANTSVNSQSNKASGEPSSAQTDFVKKLKGIDTLSQEDARYLQQYRTMRAKSATTDSRKQVSRQQAKSVSASTAQKDIDYFNKIDVSQSKRTGRTNRITLAQQVQSLVASKIGDPAVQPDVSDIRYSQASERDYIASISPAAGERVNETRIIRVRRGDTLWRIATRAYGSGFEYPRIYAANPHLTNPNLITTGEYLRVPL